MKKNIIFLSILCSFAAFLSSCTNAFNGSGTASNRTNPSSVTTRFLNFDESVLYVNTVPYGENAIYIGETPKRPSTKTTDYIFSGWDKPLENIIEDTNFYAQFTLTTKKYEITFINHDNEVLETQYLEYGSMPVYGGQIPTKPSDQAYSYTFAGWSPQIKEVTGTTTYKAQFSSSINLYEITWVVDGAITKEMYEYGQTPIYKGETQKPSNEQYTYTFTGWSPLIVPVARDATYTAQYNSSLNKYTITWLDYDGSVIYTNKYFYGATLNMERPIRENTAKYSYEFECWVPEMTSVVKDATYTAKYKETINSYTITWIVDGNITKEKYLYGSTPSFKGSTDKSSTLEYTYKFTGWSPSIKNVVSDATYTAEYSSKRNSYTVTWKNWDGTILYSSLLEYGSLPTYLEATPTKEFEELYYYDFAGWSPNIMPITGDIEYTAVFQKKDIYEYDFTSDNSECYIMKYNANIENLILPSQINNVPVTTLKAESFSLNKNLKSVVIPLGILSIEYSTFAYCSNLESVSLPNTLISIGSHSFSYCSSIKTMVVPDSVKTIGFGSFEGCTKLDTLTLPFIGESQSSNNGFLSYIFSGSKYQDYGYIVSSLKKIIIGLACRCVYGNAFYNCTSLKEVLINSNDVVIQENAFTGCSSLASVSLGDEVTSISDNAFYNSDYFGSFTIPEHVTSIGSRAFAYCKTLKTIIIPDFVQTIGNSAFCGCSNLETIILGSGIKSLGDGVFSGTKIKSIVLPSNLENIGSNAFSGCTYLESISIPNSVTSIGSYAFANCYSLSNISLGSGIHKISSNTFAYCKSLESISIPSTVKDLESGAFIGCCSLLDINFPSSLASIGEYCFSYCSSLKELYIPDSVTMIGKEAISNCSSLALLSIPFVGPSRVYTLPQYVTPYTFSYLFGKSSFDGGINSGYGNKIYAPNSLETVIVNDGEIPEDCFYNFPTIKHVIINSNIESIGQRSFGYCSSLESVKLPPSIKTIEHAAFGGCTSLSEINIPEGLANIGNYAFENCSSLTSIALPSKVSVGYFAFYGCSNLKINIISDSIESFLEFEGKEYLYETVHVLTSNYEELIDITIPNLINDIPDYAFYKCSSIESIVIEKGVTSIGEYAFGNCTSLKSIVIPDSVSLISSQAFNNCPALTDTYIKVSSIENLINMLGKNNLVGNIHIIDADNKEITSLDIPNSITSLPDYSLYNCKYIQSITIPNSVTTIGYSILKGCSSLETITIPFVGNGKNESTFACLFGTLENIPSSLNTVIILEGCTIIPTKSFYNCTSLVTIVLPSTIKAIGSQAFYNCTNLFSIEIPTDVTILGDSTFEECSSLTTITLPSYLTSIDYQAFKGCKSLKEIYFNGTISQWNAIIKKFYWNKDVPTNVVHCVDGDAPIQNI